MQAHAEHDGETTEVRVVESLGPFYALDQVKMWKGMQIAGGLGNYVREWVGGNVPTDAMIAADVASAMVVGASLHRLRTAKGVDHVDLCVSHDITLMVVRDQFLNEAAGEVEVPFLDGLVLFEADGGVWLQSRHGQPVNIAEKLSGHGF